MSWPTMGLVWACSLIPDLDSLGYDMGIPYRHWLGHRGFSHSLCFAIVIGLLAAFGASALSKKKRRLFFWFLIFSFCGIGHVLLDAMTDGGLGVALFAPFSNRRYFLPWRPIAVAPLRIGQMFSP